MKITTEQVVLSFLAVIILWKGGKALDAVWLQSLLAFGVIFFSRKAKSQNVSLPFLIIVVLLLGWTIVSFVYSATQNYGFDEVLQTASLTILVLWAAARRQEDASFAGRFAQTVSFAGLLACGAGIAVYVLQPVSRFVGTFFDHRFHTDYWPNAWAQFVLLMWPLLLWTIFTRNEKRVPKILRHDWMKGVILGFVCACLLLSYSRGGLIAFVGQFFVLGILTLLFQRRVVAWRRVPLTFISAAVTALLLFSGINSIRQKFHDVQSVAEKATFSADEGTSSVYERRDFWKQAATLAQQRPVFGWGPYSFRFLQPHIQEGVLQTSDHSHNVFLKYASERGIPAAVLLSLVFLLSLSSGFRLLRKKGSQVPIEAFLVVAIAGVIAHNLIDYNLQFVGVALPLWLSIGILVSRPGSSSRVVRRRLEVLLAFVLLLFTLFEGTNLAMSSRARRAEAHGKGLEALRWYALTDSSLFPRDAWLARGAILLSLNQLPQAEEALDRSLGYNDQDGRAWRLLGDIYLRWNKRHDALRAYEKAYGFAKYNDIGITRGLIYLLRDQDAEEMNRRRHEFDLLLNEFGLAILQNAHFIALGRNVEDLVSLCNVLAETYPDDAEAYRQLARKSQIHANKERARMASRPRGILW